jgi:hypothetical protein
MGRAWPSRRRLQGVRLPLESLSDDELRAALEPAED